MSKVYPIIFVLDCSGSMSGNPIEVINNSMKKLPKYIGEYDEDIIVKIAVLSFATRAKWMTNGLVSVDDFVFSELDAGGLTSLGAAVSELSMSMQRDFFTSDNSVGIAKPVIIFMTDGVPTDDWEHELYKANRNLWMKMSAKLVIGFQDSDKDCLCRLSENEDAVAVVDTVEQVGNLLNRLFYYSIVDGCSSLLSSPLEKATRIMNNSLNNI